MSKEKINLQEIITKAKKEASLFSTLDVDKLLEVAEDEKNDYLENKTMKDIVNDVYQALDTLPFNKTKIQEIQKKLSEYRYVERICDLHKGKHIRWIRIDGFKTRPAEYYLTNGAVVVDIIFTDTGTNVMCRNYVNTFIQIKFDDCLIFQKLSTDEELILMAYELIK
jgi:hypothetical protein